MRKTIINYVWLIVLFLCTSLEAYSQDYLDLIRIGYSQANLGYADDDAKSKLKSFDANVMIPIVINESSAVLTGVDFNSRNLALMPDASTTSLFNAGLRLGFSKTFNEKWNGYFVAMPKVSSDFDSNIGSSFLLGGLAMAKYVKRENLTYKMGLYGSQEAYGFFGTPILGIFYRSPNEKLTLDLSLPLLGDLNYGLSNSSSIGVDFQAVRRSFYLGEDNATQQYVENNEIILAPYYQFRTLDNKLLFRAKAGYSTADFGVYSTSSEKMIGLSAFNFGDNRTQSNLETSGGLYFNVQVVFRVSTKK
ncbi:DUF6268 family outer membrane beta-barrel protein [Sphingobacterium hungaricum]|uniref:DUF6268 domain-containing protein n=1 Tax=Sphingobacterium hungaricum TaxID=2082723 RepID=A0A928V2D4_9SPHI|nr:DUF6268 family outer membrane beta-barrel protein [Sphingobacterium hungaricum]MBE8714874.1 hypothetical protein [Sphingobacterium hungaricum]